MSYTTQSETTVGKTKAEEYIRLKDSDTAPVWIRGHYDRSAKRYAIYKADDMMHEAFVKASRKCFVGFTY